MNGPLQGLRVLDLTHARAGPVAVRLLADWGADVIRIEPPGEGLELFRQPAADADVLVESFPSAVKQRLGIDYPAIRAINPGIIYASISGFGQDGPYGDRAGVDQIIQRLSGLMSVTGDPMGSPVRVGVGIRGVSAGMFIG
jgi:crotonobetainyl-CoA:carnitine CoA-transferase CaiB-like acyl-CoA transferase